MTASHARISRIGATVLGLTLVSLLGLAVARCGDDDGDRCDDPCSVPGEWRCGGPIIQQCAATADGCGDWVNVQDCGATSQVCLDQGSGPVCGTLCTDQCSLGGSQCLGSAVQQCEANAQGCLRWVEAAQCASATEVCEVVSGDATCVSN